MRTTLALLFTACALVVLGGALRGTEAVGAVPFISPMFGYVGMTLVAPLLQKRTR